LCYECYFDKCVSWDTVVVVVHRLRDGLLAKARGQENFIFSITSGPSLWPSQAPEQCLLVALTPRVKQSGRETDYWLPFYYEIESAYLSYLYPGPAFGWGERGICPGR
jgi:hypothetical protein